MYNFGVQKLSFIEHATNAFGPRSVLPANLSNGIISLFAYCHIHGTYNLGQNKMEQQTPIPPQIKDEAARRAKTRHFPILDLGGRGGLGFPFILSKIVGPTGSDTGI